MRSIRGLAVILLFVVTSGCGEGVESGDDATTTSPTVPTTAASSTTTTLGTTSTSPVPTTAASSTTVATSTTSTTMPVQEPVAGPVPGTVWMVVSVRHDDVLNVRSAPGVGAAVVGTLDPTEHDVVALGSASLIDRSIWWEIDAGGVTGWSNARYLGAMGMTTDTTSDVVATLGSIPSAGTMEELAQIVVAARWPEPGGDDVVVVVDAGGVSGDIGEISLDVLPAEGDDSVRGERLVVFGQRDGGAGPFSLMAAEVTMICWRGADPSGLCV